MDLPGTVLPALLALAAYSAGSVLAAGSRRVAPALGDLLTVAVLWAALLPASAELGRWPAAAAGLLAGAGAGAAGVALRSGGADPRAEHDDAGARPGRWAAWRRFATRLGSFQGRMLMGFFYFVALPPFALLARLRGDGREVGAPATFWLPRPAAPAGLDRAREQF